MTVDNLCGGVSTAGMDMIMHLRDDEAVTSMELTMETYSGLSHTEMNGEVGVNRETLVPVFKWNTINFEIDAPTRTPTLAPTSQPTTTSPSAIPTESPTAAPTPIPSAAPTAVPTKTPTAVPTTAGATNRPSALPTKTPTRRPTAVPSTATPTAVPSTATPTAAPTPATETSVTFTTAAKVDGVNSTDFDNDPALGESYIDAMAATTNISVDSITIVSVTDSDDESRRFLRDARVLLSSSVIVETELSVILENIGKQSTDGMSFFQEITNAVSSGVSSGSFGKKLETAAASRGVTKPVAVDTGFQVVATDPIIVQQRTVAPTSSPTLAPAGGDDDDNAGAFSIFGLKSNDSIGVLIAIIVVGLCILVVIVYVFFFHGGEEEIVTKNDIYEGTNDDNAIVKTGGESNVVSLDGMEGQSAPQEVNSSALTKDPNEGAMQI